MQQYMKFLGLKVKDTVTGFTGVCTHVGFDLYGCIQAIVTPPVNDKGEAVETKWFDLNRLMVVDETPVMAVPSFGRPVQALAGPEDKPSKPSK